jgi:hypothetical protein
MGNTKTDLNGGLAMSYSSDNNFPLIYDQFEYELSRLFGLCGLMLNDTRAKIFYEEFSTVPGEYLKSAFKRIIANPPNKITGALIRAMLRDVMPGKKTEYIPGCEYCETGGTVPYVRVINDHPYTFVARCHKCRSSVLKHLPFYNEVMPRDDLQPRQREAIKDARGEFERVIQTMTMREAEDAAQELYRRRTLARAAEPEKTYGGTVLV